MDALVGTQQYIHEMTRLAGPGMKVFLMDKETTSIVSCAFAQSEMMAKEVYLFERIDTGADREPLKFLKCLVFIRPSQENVQLLCTELRKPKYAQYYLYFSNIISKADLKLLAEADEFESVREVHEFYGDGIPLAPYLVSLNQPLCYEKLFFLSPSVQRRCVNALVSLCLQFKKQPVVRYMKSSSDAKSIADELVRTAVREDQLFESCRADTIVVIMDRSEDPVTPLLNQWTYEAMVHELIGLSNNRVNMTNVPDEGMKNIVLSAQHDDFYSKNRYLNFGEIGQNIKTLMNDYQKKAQTHQKLESISDMKRFVDQYPQFKKITGTVSKHVQLVGELSRLVAAQNLLEISELEQNLVANGDHASCLEKIRRVIGDAKTTDLNALRLVMLYALRFEEHHGNVLSQLIDLLGKRGVDQRQIDAVRTLLQYAGARRRNNDLFGTKSAFEMTKRLFKGLKGVENVYIQHEPYIAQVIEQLTKARLSDAVFAASDPACMNTRYENIILFIIGGATFEESSFVHGLNERRTTNPGLPRVLLASTCVHNTSSFIDQIVALGPNFAASLGHVV